MEKTLQRYSTLSRRISLKSNSAYLAAIEKEIYPGELYNDRLGLQHLREGRYENGAEVWSRELKKIQTPLVGMIDADFEILDPGFVPPMLDEFAVDQSLAFYSTDYTDRYDTWFCIYRGSVLDLCSNFTGTDETPQEGLSYYDHGAMMQETLITKYGYRGKVLQRRFRSKYIHYGAFSKNRSLRGFPLRAYRFVRIGRRSGWVHLHGIGPIACLLRLFSHSVYLLTRMDRFDEERSRYL